MSYLDILKKMNNYTNSTDAIVKYGKELENLHFTEDPSYRLAKIYCNDLSSKDLDIRIKNNSTNVNERKFILRPNTKTIACGSIIAIDEGDYLCLENMEYNSISPTIKAKRCNQELVINKDISFPCITSNQAYGAKINVSSDFIPFPDVKLSIDVQENKITRKLPLGYRFIFDHSKSDIYKIIDKTMNITKGIIEITCEKDSCLQYDDLENNIAYQTIEGIDFENDNDIVVEYEIDGLKTIRVNRIEQYNINFSEKNGKFEIIDSSSENDYEVTSQTNENIKLKALNIGFVTIGYIINDKVVCQYDVMFER